MDVMNVISNVYNIVQIVKKEYVMNATLQAGNIKMIHFYVYPYVVMEQLMEMRCVMMVI